VVASIAALNEENDAILNSYASLNKDPAELRTVIEHIKSQGFSDNLISILEKTLAFDEGHRLDFIQL
jgi:hypothetical protein